MCSTHLAKNSPERSAQRRAAFKLQCVAIAPFPVSDLWLLIVFVQFIHFSLLILMSCIRQAHKLASVGFEHALNTGYLAAYRIVVPCVQVFTERSVLRTTSRSVPVLSDVHSQSADVAQPGSVWSSWERRHYQGQPGNASGPCLLSAVHSTARSWSLTCSLKRSICS